MALTAWVSILAPLLALAMKLPTGGWLLVFILYASPLLLGGYVLLVVAVARGMLRRQGVLRERPRRARAIAWAWLTSIGVLLLGLTMIDGGDTPASVQSTLTLLLGAPESPSPAHALSENLAYGATIAWLVGWFALLVEWAVAGTRRRPEAPRVAPPKIG